MMRFRDRVEGIVTDIRSVTVLLALGILLGACNSGPEPLFDSVDADHDQAIDSGEFLDYFFQSAFSALDADADGSISRTEWSLREKGPRGDALFLELDRNQDDAIDRAEFVGPEGRKLTIENLFRTLDRNGDGVLEQDELQGEGEQR